MNKKGRNIYLVDGNCLCYRAFYAIHELSTSRGVPTNAVYGFLNMLRKLIREHEPEMLTIVFDSKGPTVRHAKYEDYKIHRKPMPEDLVDQIPRIKEVIDAYNISICELEGYEADDIIATLVEKAGKKGLDVTIVTGDKDALQLVSDKVRVLSHHAADEKVYGIDEVTEKYGVAPDSMVELMALMGDASDNIPGVKGIGLVTASKLIAEFGDLKGVYKNIENISSASVKKKLAEGREMAELSRELVELDRKVPVKLDLDKARMSEPDQERLVELFREFEFEKLLREMMPAGEDEGDYSVKEDVSSVEKIVRAVAKKKMVSLRVMNGPDGQDVAGIAFCWKEGKACFVPLGKGSSASRDATKLVKGMLEDGSVRKIGHDLKKDMLALRSRGIDVKGAAFDVMIADYLIDPSRPKYDLEGMAMRHLGYNLSREESGIEWDEKGQASIDLSGAGGFEHDCRKCDVILRLYNTLNPVLEEKRLEELFRDVEMPLVRVLADMEAAGVGVDTGYLKEQSRSIGKKLEDVSKKIYKLAGEDFNINSPKQLQVILYDKLGLPVTKRTKTGASTDESVLRKLASCHELPGILLEYREMNKLKTGYYDSIIELVDRKTGRLHAHFNQAVTATGRLSSSEPNLQNIPIKTTMGKEIRRAFVPGEKDKVLIAADYSQIELRILAHLSGDKNLVEAFKGEEDVHRFTASLIFDCPPDKVTEEMRSAAKTVNFAIIYGMSPFGLAKDLGISVEEAYKFIGSYFKRYSGVSGFIDKTIDEAKKKGYVTTLLKRRRYIPEIKSPNERLKGFAERVAVNTPVQGSAADLIKLAMIACHEEFEGTGVSMIIQVHDELVFEVPVKMMKDVAGKVKEIMEGVIDLKVPLKVDIESGSNWLDLEPVVL
ncbi:MAG: DNA polymerase I [Candidatus Omnitrophota bacterium]|nr:DNA polymerase I [Candidatus Omnitrophota bacterium]